MRRCLRGPLLLLWESILSRQLSWSPGVPGQEESSQGDPSIHPQARVEEQTELQRRKDPDPRPPGFRAVATQRQATCYRAVVAKTTHSRAQGASGPSEPEQTALLHPDLPSVLPHSLSSIFLLLSLPGWAIPSSPLME